MIVIAILFYCLKSAAHRCYEDISLEKKRVRKGSFFFFALYCAKRTYHCTDGMQSKTLSLKLLLIIITLIYYI